MTTFSFHPVKAMTTGEGGARHDRGRRARRRLRLFRTHGITKDGVDPSATEGDWYYEMQALGFNYRITDFQCALGLSQLQRLDELDRARATEIAARYRELLADEERIALPPAAPDGDRCTATTSSSSASSAGAEARLAAFDALRAAGIGVQVHYIPIYRLPYYRDVLGYPQDECPAAEEYYAGAISLPMFPGDDRRRRRARRVELQRGAPVRAETRSARRVGALLERARRVIPGVHADAEQEPDAVGAGRRARLHRARRAARTSGTSTATATSTSRWRSGR